MFANFCRLRTTMHRDEIRLLLMASFEDNDHRSLCKYLPSDHCEKTKISNDFFKHFLRRKNYYKWVPRVTFVCERFAIVYATELHFKNKFTFRASKSNEFATFIILVVVSTSLATLLLQFFNCATISCMFIWQHQWMKINHITKTMKIILRNNFIYLKI